MTCRCGNLGWLNLKSDLPASGETTSVPVACTDCGTERDTLTVAPIMQRAGHKVGIRVGWHDDPDGSLPWSQHVCSCGYEGERWLASPPPPIDRCPTLPVLEAQFTADGRLVMLDPEMPKAPAATP